MSSDEISAERLYRRGVIKCGSVERRRLLEESGRELEVEFIGAARDAGRQADEGDHLDDRAPEAEARDPYEEAYLDE